MIDINIYRCRIGLFSPKIRVKSVSRNHDYSILKKTFPTLKIFFTCSLIANLLFSSPAHEYVAPTYLYTSSGQAQVQAVHAEAVIGQYLHHGGVVQGQRGALGRHHQNKVGQVLQSGGGLGQSQLGAFTSQSQAHSGEAARQDESRRHGARGGAEGGLGVHYRGVVVQDNSRGGDWLVPNQAQSEVHGPEHQDNAALARECGGGSGQSQLRALALQVQAEAEDHSHSGKAANQEQFRAHAAQGHALVGEDRHCGGADSEIINHNFEARYLHGNIQRKKGILNMHLNIRSLQNKVYEVKQIIKENKPTILGLSECELLKDKVEEKTLKIPGYKILFPKSWDRHGRARVVVYVKDSFKYQQVCDLEDEQIQSVWLKGSHRNTKEIFFCHSYREHLSGQGIAAQTEYFASFLGQWEAATLYGGRTEPNEVHICGDMNVDIYQDRWLHPNYHLITLSRMMKSMCDVNNFHQLVKSITRLQFNSVTNTTSMSIIDHVYTNARFRCSDVEVSSFGDSDHDIVSYTRYSKKPPEPARLICMRSYKNFDSSKFLADIEKTDWSEVYACIDPEEATKCFTSRFRYTLNIHAPWTRIQQRKTFCPWITAETKNLMKQKDLWKQKAKELAEQVGATPESNSILKCNLSLKKCGSSIFLT